jgi:hypothetical protein
MNIVEARAAAITKVSAVLAANLPALPAFYENSDAIPIAEVGDAFVRIRMDFNNAKQAEMGQTPITRHAGELCITHAQRTGTGTAALLARANTINNELKHFSSGQLQFAVPYPGRKESHDGWYFQDWCVPFWFHD